MILGADLAFADEYIDKVKSQVYSEFRDERPLSVVMSSRQDCEKGSGNLSTGTEFRKE
jgi:hypothetical protein